MIILGSNLTLRCDSCGAQMGLGRTTVDAIHKRMPSGWMALDKGRHSCSLCTAAHTPFALRIR